MRIDDIEPELIAVQPGTQEAALFSAVTLLWSVPVSRGFGRRIRLLVRDGANGKLIGIIGLTDPVFNLRPRDAWVGWTSKDREERLVHVMDAFVIGAVPPYSLILGGKLIALLAGCTEIVQLFRKRYGHSEGIISQSKKDPRLVLVTTTSALGRSSLYNRLRIPGGIEYVTDEEPERVGDWYTQGYGHFHVDEDLFCDLQALLRRRGDPYATGNRFGDGPNWRMRVIRKAASELGIEKEVLRHGVRRQVYVVPLAHNTRSLLRGESKRVRYKTRTAADTVKYWRERWAVPRAERQPEWVKWNCGGMMRGLRLLYSEATTVGDSRNGPCEL